ncbi:MAG TPA: TrkA family potassium uptake protein [Candidatus Limnocylindrales bacterium]|nr:TrkA family potassium uptake protein [Candidatus Limnocylindrales bacterium]
MKTVIVGCGRVGAGLADVLDRAGHEVTIIDRTTTAFDRLPSTFGGTAVRGDGTDEDVLRRAGAEGADLFLALTEGDNRNIMAAQLAVEAFGARRTIAKVNDPVRAEAYGHLGIATLCRTTLMMSAVLEGFGLADGLGPGLIEARPHAHGHEGEAGSDAPASTTAPGAPAGAAPGAREG